MKNYLGQPFAEKLSSKLNRPAVHRKPILVSLEVCNYRPLLSLFYRRSVLFQNMISGMGFITWLWSSCFHRPTKIRKTNTGAVCVRQTSRHRRHNVQVTDGSPHRPNSQGRGKRQMFFNQDSVTISLTKIEILISYCQLCALICRKI